MFWAQIENKANHSSPPNLLPGISPVEKWQSAESRKWRGRRSHSRMGNAPGRPLFARISGRAQAKWLLHHMPDAGACLRGYPAAVAQIRFGRINYILGHSCDTAGRRTDRGNGARQSTPICCTWRTFCALHAAKIQSQLFSFPKGPVFPQPLKSPDDIRSLNFAGVADRLSYVGEAIRKTRHAINGQVPLLGFSGAPVNAAFHLDCAILRQSNVK